MVSWSSVKEGITRGAAVGEVPRPFLTVFSLLNIVVVVEVNGIRLIAAFAGLSRRLRLNGPDRGSRRAARSPFAAALLGRGLLLLARCPIVLIRFEIMPWVKLSVLDVGVGARTVDTDALLAFHNVALVKDSGGAVLADITLHDVSLASVPFAVSSFGVARLFVERMSWVEGM